MESRYLEGNSWFPYYLGVSEVLPGTLKVETGLLGPVRAYSRAKRVVRAFFSHLVRKTRFEGFGTIFGLEMPD